MYLNFLINPFVIAIFGAALTLFLDFCMMEGNIFGLYGSFINKYGDRFWAKPLGGCKFCFGTWVYIVLFLVFNAIYNKNTGVIEVAFCTIIGLGINYLFINIFEKITE